MPLRNINKLLIFVFINFLEGTSLLESKQNRAKQKDRREQKLQSPSPRVQETVKRKPEIAVIARSNQSVFKEGVQYLPKKILSLIK